MRGNQESWLRRPRGWCERRRSRWLWRVIAGVVLVPALMAGVVRAELVEVQLAGIDPRGESQVVLFLIDEPGMRMLPISVSPGQAESIYRGRAGVELPRPMTHELMLSAFEALEARITRVDITDLRDNTYYAELFLQNREGKILKIDSRPSDAIALALRVDAPIHASRVLMLPLEKSPRPEVEPHPVLSSLGLHLQELTEELARFFDAGDLRGVLVAEAASGSPSERSGVQRGDIIQSVGEKSVHTVTEALSALREAREQSDWVEVQVVRGGREHSLKLEW